MCSVQRFLAALFAVAVLLLGGLPGGAVLAATSTATSDFTDNLDGTVTHKTTGLTWKRCAEGQTWSGSTCSGAAQLYTLNAALARGSNGWALPTIEQLRTIVAMGFGAGAPTINPTVFPNTPASNFWSASAYAYGGGSGYTWFVAFDTGDSGGYDSNTVSGLYARLVRSGQPVETSTPAASTNGATTPAPTSSSQGFSASVTASGDITRQTLQGRVNVHPNDIGNTGGLFVVAVLPNSTLYYHGPDGSWSPSLQTYFRGTLASSDVGIVESPTDLSALGDTKVYLGYGRCLPFAIVSRCYDDMNNSAAVHLVHTIPFKGKLGITSYTQSSTNGAVSPLVSVTNNSGQQITYWGLKDKAGTPFALTETLFKDPATGDQIRTLYGTHGLPRKFVNLKTGESATVQWGLSGGVFRLYDANGRLTLGYGLAVNASGKLAATPLTNSGQFAADPDDIDISVTSVADQALVKKNAKDIGNAIAVAGVMVCAYSSGALCPAGAFMVGVGLATKAAANCETDCGAGKINNLFSNLKDKSNTVMGWFSKGWKSTGTNSTGADSGPGVPDVIDNPPQYTTTDIPATQKADSSAVQALAIKNQSVSTTPSWSPCFDGQYMSALTNMCETIPACPYGYVSDNKGYCIEPRMCTAPNVIQNEQCISSTPVCNPATQTLKGGQCVNKLICDAYQKEQNGVCVPDCTSAQEVINGVCVTRCASNQTRQNGVCVTPQPTPTYTQPTQPQTTTPSSTNPACKYDPCRTQGKGSCACYACLGVKSYGSCGK